MQVIKANSNLAKLYIVATPIGNLSEISPRTVTVLQEVDYVICEDTRVTSKLLNYLQLKKNLISFHKYNENQSVEHIIQLLNDGFNLALVSDAGYPLISDPGFPLMRALKKYQYPVIPISGSCAFLNALVASKLNINQFYFYGFIERNNNTLHKLTQLKNLSTTIIFYLSPHSLTKDIEFLSNIFGDCEAVLARELTKLYEEFIYGSLTELASLTNIKGELVLIIENKTKVEVYDLNQVLELLLQEKSVTKDLIKDYAKRYNQNSKELYKLFQQSKGEK